MGWLTSQFMRLYNGVIATRVGLENYQAQTKTFYQLQPGPRPAWTDQPAMVGYASTTGFPSVSYPIQSNNVPLITAQQITQPSGLATPYVNELPSEDLLALANIVRPVL